MLFRSHNSTSSPFVYVCVDVSAAVRTIKATRRVNDNLIKEGFEMVFTEAICENIGNCVSNMHSIPILAVVKIPR